MQVSLLRGLGYNRATLAAVFAYLDPGSGSMILQVLAGGVASVAVGAKMFWRKLPFVGKKRRAHAEEPTDS